MRKHEGILTVVSGFSGSGKGTIMKRLLERYPDEYALSISATTRQPRPGEEHGKEYFFVSPQEFEAMIRQNQLIEHAQYVGNYYGTPKAYVEEQLAEGRNVILEIELVGALKVKEKFPDALLLFVTPPSAEELKRRLTDRGTEEEAVICARLRRAAEEALGAEQYDYLVVNDDLEECITLVHDIIECEHCRMSRNRQQINEMRRELEGFTKKGE